MTQWLLLSRTYSPYPTNVEWSCSNWYHLYSNCLIGNWHKSFTSLLYLLFKNQVVYSFIKNHPIMKGDCLLWMCIHKSLTNNLKKSANHVVKLGYVLSQYWRHTETLCFQKTHSTQVSSFHFTNTLNKWHTRVNKLPSVKWLGDMFCQISLVSD